MKESWPRPRLSLRQIYMDGDQATAVIGRIGLVVWRRDTTEQAVNRVREMGQELLRIGAPSVCIVGVVEGTATVPSASARALSARVNDDLAEQGVVGYAGVMPARGFPGAWIRGVITALHLLARRRYPFRVFETTEDACRWLTQVLGDSTINAKQVATAIDLFRGDYERRWLSEFQ